MSRLLLDGRLHPGQEVRVTAAEGALDFAVADAREPAASGQA